MGCCQAEEEGKAPCPEDLLAAVCTMKAVGCGDSKEANAALWEACGGADDENWWLTGGGGGGGGMTRVGKGMDW